MAYCESRGKQNLDGLKLPTPVSIKQVHLDLPTTHFHGSSKGPLSYPFCHWLQSLTLVPADPGLTSIQTPFTYFMGEYLISFMAHNSFLTRSIWKVRSPVSWLPNEAYWGMALQKQKPGNSLNHQPQRANESCHSEYSWRKATFKQALNTWSHSEYNMCMKTSDCKL